VTATLSTPRPSLWPASIHWSTFPKNNSSQEVRYGTHNGYVCAITTATKTAVSQGFLLPSAATALIGDAQASNVLSGVSASPADQARAASLCSGQ
jgi:hypothetical protein